MLDWGRHEVRAPVEQRRRLGVPLLQTRALGHRCAKPGLLFSRSEPRAVHREVVVGRVDLQAAVKECFIAATFR